MIASRALAAALATAGVLGAGACSGGGAPVHLPSSAAPTVARWWSNQAVTSGSTVDPHNPEQAVLKLQPSRDDYCGMLRQTVSAGRSILPGGTGSLPLDTLEAFVGEIQTVAPAGVAGSWQVLGKAILGYVRSGGKSLGSAAPSATDVAAAATAVFADAKSSCHVDLSASAPPITRPSR